MAARRIALARQRVVDAFTAMDGLPQALSADARRALRRAAEAALEAAEAPQSDTDTVIGALQLADAIAITALRIVSDRLIPPWVQPLHLADTLTTDTLRRGLAALAPNVVTPVPLVCLDAMASPMARHRQSAVTLPTWLGQTTSPGATTPLATLLPLAQVLLPAEGVRSAPWLVVILHEAGHHVDWAAHDGLSGPLRAALSPELYAWAGWSSEIAADLIAAAVGGPGYIDALGACLADLGPYDRWPSSGPHPPGPLRVLLLAEMFVGMNSDSAAIREARDLAERLLPARLAELPAVVTAIRGAGDARIGVALDALAADRDGWARAVGDAHHARPHADGLDHLYDAVHGRATPVGHLTQPWIDLLSDTVRQLAPTFGRDRRGYKRPPAELMAAAQDLVFIGETHGQLAASLRSALSLRAGRPWSSVRIWFLSDDAIRRRVDPSASPEDRLTEKRAAMVALPALLVPAVVAEVRYAEHDDPSMYASFFGDADGWFHVHTSAQVWSTPLRTSPSVDYRRTHGESDTIARLAEGLAHLAKGPRLPL